jgi:hypothetical protein
MLALRLLTNVNNVNDYDRVAVVSFNNGVNDTIYFQLVQPGREGLRYVPASGATLTVTVWNIDDAKKVTRAASQPFLATGDASIWSVPILNTDPIAGTPALQVVLTEGANVTQVLLQGGLRFNSADPLR